MTQRLGPRSLTQLGPDGEKVEVVGVVVVLESFLCDGDWFTRTHSSVLTSERYTKRCLEGNTVLRWCLVSQRCV